MRRDEFLKELDWALRDLKSEEKARYISNYAELVDDKLESGISEEKAIAELGDPRAIAVPIIADAREQGLLKPKRSPLTVCLLILGSPVWVSLMAAAFAVLLAVYVVIWALIISACAVELSLAVVFPASVVYFAVNAAANLAFSLFVLGLGLLCAAAAAALWQPTVKLIKALASLSGDKVKKAFTKLKSKGRAII